MHKSKIRRNIDSRELGPGKNEEEVIVVDAVKVTNITEVVALEEVAVRDFRSSNYDALQGYGQAYVIHQHSRGNDGGGRGNNESFGRRGRSIGRRI